MNDISMADMESLSAIVQNEGDTAFEDKENDTTSESQPEKNDETESPSHQGEESSTESKEEKNNTDDEKGNVRFDKHPRFKELVEEKNRLKQEIEELKSTVHEKLQSPDKNSVHIPQWFTKLYGEDADAWNEYQSYENQRFTQWESSMKQKELEQKKAYDDQIKKWEDYSNKQLERLENEGKEFDKNEFMKLIIEFQPIDKQGNIDFDKAYEIYELKKKAEYNPAKSQAKKNIAASTVSESKGEPSKRDYVTSKDLRGKSAMDLVS